MRLNNIAKLAATTIFMTSLTMTVSHAQELETLDQKLSYIVGQNMATQFKRDGIELDPKAIVLAIEDVKNGREPRFDDATVRETIAALQKRAQEKQAARAEAAGQENKAKGEAFLTENGAKEGVVTLENGLQYKVLTKGAGGAKPTAEDTVTVHYVGTLIDGKEFDSSIARGQPASFPVNGVIPGWTQILQLMSVGDKWQVTIPSQLAYGPNGAGNDIGPNAVLQFDIELIKIN